MANRSVPAPFLMKTYQLVDDPSTDDMISWNDRGTTFVVWKAAEFARDLLPNYFKHNNFSSFVRQLNTYGFRKIVPDRWEFQNELFKRGEKELVCEIHRRKTTHASTVQIAPTGKANGGHLSHSSSGDEVGSSSTSTKNNVSSETEETTTTQLSTLSGENEKLRKDNHVLNLELAKTKQQCQDLIAFITKHANIAPNQIKQVVMQGGGVNCPNNSEIVHNYDEKEEGCLKLFGVMLTGKKRAREEMTGLVRTMHIIA